VRVFATAEGVSGVSRIGRGSAALLTVGLVGLAFGGIAFASGQQIRDRASRGIVVRVVTRATEVNDFVDTGPAGASPGDLYVFEERVFKTSTSTKQIGTASGSCSLIVVNTLRYHCTILSRLPDGDIMTGGELDLKIGAVSSGPILGGTGKYRNARGEATLKLGPLEGPHEVTYSLILGPNPSKSHPLD
jgi:hypothetical protein